MELRLILRGIAEYQLVAPYPLHCLGRQIDSCLSKRIVCWCENSVWPSPCRVVTSSACANAATSELCMVVACAVIAMSTAGVHMRPPLLLAYHAEGVKLPGCNNL